MKIDRSLLKKSMSEVPGECQALINKLRSCTNRELLEVLKKIDTWTLGKCELYHWIDILDMSDAILEEAATRVEPSSWTLACDLPENSDDKELVLWVLHFTRLLVEHSFSRHLYNSMEHLITLLSSSDMNVVLGVLNFLYVFSKYSSNFITRLNNDKREALLSRLTHLAESWGGKESGFGLADCCKDVPAGHFPPSSTTLHFEYYSEVPESTSSSGKGKYSNLIHIENVDKMNKTSAAIMNELLEQFDVPADKQMQLFTHIRLAQCFSDRRLRLLCVQARLQALSVLIYSNALAENAHTLLYSGILEELVELLQMPSPNLVEIKVAALRALTSIIYLGHNPHFPNWKPGSRLNMIIDVTGAGSYHGFLPALVRTCIMILTSTSSDSNSGAFPLPLATALFSFLYHLAYYRAGKEALVSCGMMESLLRVINWPGTELQHITFVTRAVRVIDLITTIDMQAFQTHGGLSGFINRLEMEVNICRKEQPFEITFPNTPSEASTSVNRSQDTGANSVISPMEVSSVLPSAQESSYVSETVPSTSQGSSSASTSKSSSAPLPDYSAARTGKICLSQRAALLKSMLNFLKTATREPAFSDSIRHVMEGSLPSSLKHIISNAEYYGPSLFMLAIDVVTVYVFEEPSLLSSLQDNGLTDVVMHALLVKDVPATREVIRSRPNVFRALCLNTRGLGSFVRCNPFDRLFKVLFSSPVYLAAMNASYLGSAMNELMNYQPSFKVDATYAIIKLLEELCVLGRDPKYVCWRAQNKMDVSPAFAPRPSRNYEGGSSDEEDKDEEAASTSSHPQHEDSISDTSALHEKTPIALIDYILNVMKFVNPILSNNDHCREFVAQDGLVPLLSILGLPNLPVDYPVTTAAQAVASVCKYILNLTNEPQVLKQGLVQLNKVLEQLQPLHSPVKAPGSSVLLHELASAPNLETAFTSAIATPLLHAVGAAHGYVVMFVHVCCTGKTDIQTLSLTHWGSELGLNVLNGLAELYTSLVWESTLLLALCSDDIIPPGCKFGREDMEKLLPPEMRVEGESSWVGESMDAVSTETAMEVDVETTVSTEKSSGDRMLPTALQLKYITPLLDASSRLGKALAKLFGLLVKLCVGSPIRASRGQQVQNTPAARAVATALNILLANGLNWTRLPQTTIPKFKLTFLIRSVEFTSAMLFYEKKYPSHLMLQKFVNLGGQNAFFDTFRWALSNGLTLNVEEGLEHPDLTDGTGEFLDAWLLLLEKMVNPKAILDSPHTITMKHGAIYKPFDPLKYLITIHKLAFDAVMLMWGKKPLKSYGPRMSESMLAILCHILRGEKIIAERLGKEKENVAASQGEGSNSSSARGSSSTGPTPTTQRRQQNESSEPDVNGEWLLQLMDMGFSREHCVEALLHTPSVEQATDYLLSNPSLFICSTQEFEMHVLCKEAIDSFTMTAFPACLNLVDTLPDTVYCVCDLLITITKRNGELWRDEMLDILVADISEKAKYLLQVMKSGETPSQIVSELMNSSAAMKIAGRIHLFTLLFEGPVFQEMRVPCAQVVQRSQILPSLVQLLVQGQEALTAVGEVMTPKWLAPLLLLIDSLEKVAMCTQRRDKMYEVTNRIWRWFDLTSAKWTTYSSSNNKIINDAYWNGDSTVHINCGRKRYMIQFATMSQVNEERANCRPVTMSLIAWEKAEGKDHAPKEKNYEKEKVEKMETEDPSLQEEREKKKNVVVQGLERADTSVIVRACVGLLAIPVDRDTLHAVMRVCLRLTRNFENAMIFAGLGGVRLLLNLTQASSFTGFFSLSTLLIRHVMEEPQTLRHAMEEVLRTMLPNIPPPHKELLYLLRNSPSIVTRDPETFLEVARSCLRVDLKILSKRNEEEDMRLLVKTLPSKHTPALPMQEEMSTTVVYDLLNCLIRPTPREDPTSTTSATNAVQAASGDGGELQNEQNPYSILVVRNTGSGSVSNFTSVSTSPSGSSLSLSNGNSLQLAGHAQRASTAVQQSLRQQLLRNLSSSDLLHNEVDERAQELDRKKVKEDLATYAKINEEEKKRPLLPKSAILEILKDAVYSYSGCAKLITDHTYCAGQSEMVTEDCTALAFLLDKLLLVSDNPVDRKCSTKARMLIATLASCNHSPDAQTVLVTEVKAALLRTLGLPESADKHEQIQRLARLISTMIHNCPSTRASLKLPQYSSHTNNIVCIMLRKGILTDLARVSHYLDLSSPNMPASVNAALKPLETLSRIVNQPTATSSSKVGKQKNQGSVSEEPAGDQTGRDVLTGTTTLEATHAQGEETVEDTENTEHDISAAAESLEPTSESQVQEGGGDVAGDEGGLEDIMEQLLDRETALSENNILNASFNMEPEVQNNPVDNERGGVRNQTSPTYENEEDDTQDAGAAESSDSDSDINPSEEIPNVEDDEDDDDEDDDDEDDDDDNDDDDALHHITPNHPLLMARQNLEVGSITASRAQRSNRQRRYQYHQLNHRNPIPPVILQRLLHLSAHDIPASASQALTSPFHDTNSEEEQDQSGYPFGPSPAARLTNIPLTLHWWMEECKLLDGDSSPDCVTAVVHNLVPHLEKLRDEELSEKREKRRKQQEESEAKKRKVDDDSKKSDNEESAMEVVISSGEGLSKNLSNQSSNSGNTTAAADVASATENLAESIVDSVLRPAISQSRTSTIAASASDNAEDQDGEDDLDRPERDEDQEMDHAPVEVRAAPDFSGLATGLLSSLSEILPSVTAAQRALRVGGDVGVSQETESESYPEASYVSSYPNSASRLDSTQLGSMLAQSCNTVTPAPTAVSYNRDEGEESVRRGQAEAEYDSDNSNMNPACGPPPLIPLEEVVNMELGENVDEDDDEDDNDDDEEDDDDAPIPSGDPDSAFERSGGNTENSNVHPVASTSSGVETAVINSEIPEGVDPSFLAALPDEMREEVIAEQLRLQRLHQRAQQQSTEAVPPSVTEVNPEFLAALPPAIQEEILAQQRQAAAAFFQNLQPSLRHAILTDMEDSQISILPSDLAREAQNLHQEWEAHNRQMMQEHLFGHVSHSSRARSSIPRGRVGTTRYAIHTVPQRAQWGAWNSRQEAHPSLSAFSSGNLRLHGRQLLDYEAISCLLVLLFVDEPKLNTLCSVLRNLCYHTATREWVIKALLSIMEKCNDCRSPDSLALPKPRRMSTRSQPHTETAVRKPSWLNISLNAALGCRASVLTIVKEPGKEGKSQDAANVTIHPQAAPNVFRHTLEVLISLAKGFPGYFLPLKSKDECKYKDSSLLTDARLKLSPGSSGSGGSRASRSDGTSFWEMLLKLDSITTTKEGKSVARVHSASALSSESEGHATTFETSAFGQLLTMLASPVVKRSCLLTDKLLRLLSLISIGLQRRDGNSVKKPEEKDESAPVSEQHLKLAIDVLTSKSCSEEGLEDATALLVNMANCPDPTRDMILHLLLDGAMEFANKLNDHIGALLQELKAMNRNLKGDEIEETHTVDRPPKGVVHDRFTKDNVIVTAPTTVKTSCDLHLPSMATLTSKTSSQAFFMQILKVIVQIRESVRLAHRRNRENSESLDYFNQGDSSADEVPAGPDEPVAGSAMDTSSPSAATSHGRRTSSSAESRAPSRRHATRSRDTESANITAPPPAAAAAASAADVLDVDSDADVAVSSRQQKEGEEEVVLPTLSEQLTLDKLWDTLSSCLLELADTPDHHAVLVLQPAVEAFFLVHATAAKEHRLAYDGREGRNTQEQRPRENPAPPEVAIIQPDVAPVSSFPSDSDGNSTNLIWEVTPSPVTLPPDQQKFLKFAETHRTVLNQILRLSTTHLADGPFAVLVDYARVLDFDVKRRYFRSELEIMDEEIMREEIIAVHVRRSHVFEDSFLQLHMRSADEWKHQFYIVFEGEEGVDAGGLLREWYVIISREIFNPMYALFTTSPGDRVTYMINSSSHCNPDHLSYFKFVGKVIAKAIYDNKLLECYFTRSFYKHILGILVKYTDMESEDYSFYQGLVYLMEHHVSDLGYDLKFSAEVQEFGVTEVRDLIPNGRNIQVCEQNKMDYIRLVCQMKMTGAIRKQINAFLEGFYDIIPKRLISIFNEQELELLISGLPNVDIEDLRANTEYHKYEPTSLQIQWFWRALRSFDQAARAKFLQFVTGTSKVPLQGFAALEGMDGVQKFQIHRDDRSTDRLPSAHTCFNQLDLPVYETYDKLRTYLLKAIHECSEGFGFA